MLITEEYARWRDPDDDGVSAQARVFPATRRGLEIALGVAWLIDGLLQLQPYMFGKEFFITVLGMASMGLPHWIAAMPYRVLQLLYPSHVVFNALFATVQVVIGVGLLWRRSARFALIGSFAWALTVWVGGEGFGGLFMPGMSMLTGAPGAVVIYAALSVILWPTRRGDGRSVAATSVLGERGVLGVWVVLWAGTALLELQLANNAPGGLAANLRNEAHGEPGALAAMDRFSAHLAGLRGTEVALTLALLQVLIRFQALSRERRRIVLSVALVVSLSYWVVGQNAGGILTGRGTDLGLGPMMVLLILTLWPKAPLRARVESP
ncbi:MAG: hypothetical protein ACYDB2_00150 [Acidimicrobiales bacterium]